MSYGPLGLERNRREWTEAVRLQVRVVAALIRREIRARFGESRLGYLWAIIEPLGHLAVLMFLFVYILRRRAPIGGSIVVFFLSGLIPYFLCTRLATYLIGAVAGNRALLNLPLVKPTDVIFARMILETSTYLFVAFLLFGGLAVFGDYEAIPWDPLALAEAVGIICLLGFGFGLINLTIAAFVPNWGFLFGLFIAPLYFLSGVFFTVSEVPPPYRDYLLYNPILHCVEAFRAGFYHDYDVAYIDRAYALRVALGAVVIGFGLLRVCRRKSLEPT